MITISAVLLAASLAIISIMMGSSIMASIPEEQLSFAQHSANKSTQSENRLRQKNYKAVVIALLDCGIPKLFLDIIF